MLRPVEEWLGDEHEALHMKILQADPTFDLRDRMPYETERWKGNAEFTVETYNETLDIALISSKRSFLKIPFCLDPICEGVKIFTIDVKDPCNPKIFDGRCWPSDESAGEFYDFNAFADHEFSGCPIVDTFHLKNRPIISDRHDALLGICLLDAGKKRIMGPASRNSG